MINYILFDDYSRHDLLPFTFTKPICEIRIGILTIKEKWEKYLNAPVSFQTQEYLSEKYAKILSSENVYINGKICPNDFLINEIAQLNLNTSIKAGNDLIAFKTSSQDAFDSEKELKVATEVEKKYISVKQPWDIFSKNGEALKQDFEFLTKGKKSQPLSTTNTVIGNAADVFLEEGAIVEASILNTKSGPIYIGVDAEIMEGSVVRGPFAICEHSALKLSTKIYGPTTIGPHSKVGGEINNSVIFGYSNKAHDGFLGNSVVGEWCNLGADTNNSNLKNNYGNVKLYNYRKETSVETGLQFCGLMMGDHSKCGINTMFNTGTVVGVGANIFGGNFPPTHIPSFSWGGGDDFEDYKLDKMFETTERVYARRSMTLTEIEKNILSYVFNLSKKDRLLNN